MAMGKRVWKLQDFVAHSGRAQCARLGEKSGQVLATGGDDKRVNIWKVGKPNAMMSLTGHTSAVECLVFDKQEEVLVVGCAGGSMQVWNLEYRKMAGTLSGHRTACGAVEFHPYGEFFASGSADTNLKIWDLRRKSCIQTYKGHTGPITTIRFSPHGRWVATGGQDNQVKLWDLTAGKLMRDLDVHKGPITSIAFHPKEYLLATGSADRTMKMWSLESFQTVGSTELGSSPVQAVKFYVEEQAVVAASQDALRLYPTDCLTMPQDTIEVDWKGLQDMRLCASEEKLIAISTEGAQLGIWVADLQKRENPSVKGSGYSRLHSRGGIANANRLPTQVQRRSPKPFSDAEDSDSERPHSGEQRQGDQQSEVLPASARPSGEYGCAGGVYHETPKAGQHLAPQTPGLQSCSPSNGSRDQASQARGGEARPAADAPRGGHGPSELGFGAPPAASSPHAGAAHAAASSAADPSRGAEDRLQRRGPEVNLEQLAFMLGRHSGMMGVLQRRQDRIHRLKQLWARGNLASLPEILKGPTEHAADHAALCDFARAIMRQHAEHALNLDACIILLPILRDLMSSSYDDFVTTALQFIEVLLEKFGDLIADTRRSCANVPERQLDLPREERLRKCNACHDHFRDIHRLLPNSQVGSRFGGFRSSLQTFLQSCD